MEPKSEMDHNPGLTPLDTEARDMAAFESQLRDALARRPAPPSIKRALAERGLFDAARGAKTLSFPRRSGGWLTRQTVSWHKLAACLVLTAILAGGFEWRAVEQRREEEAAHEQLLIALRITNHALSQMNARLARRHGADQARD